MLAQFVTWPDDDQGSAAAPLRFCVLADEAMAVSLQPTVRAKTIRGRTIQVIPVDAADGLSSCHLAFVGYKRHKELRAFFAQWDYPGVLLVGEAERFAELGGMVNLAIGSGKVTFQINLANVQRAHLEIRSQLLRFATLVGEPPAGKEPLR